MTHYFKLPYRLNFIFAFALFLSPLAATHAQSADKIQQTVESIKRVFYCTDEDYKTDGKRTIWVKSYKRWRPEDWATVQKEAPYVLKCLHQAIDHNRPDILNQLMPDYYRSHGGPALPLFLFYSCINQW